METLLYIRRLLHRLQQNQFIISFVSLACQLFRPYSQMSGNGGFRTEIEQQVSPEGTVLSGPLVRPGRTFAQKWSGGDGSFRTIRKGRFFPDQIISADMIGYGAQKQHDPVVTGPRLHKHPGFFAELKKQQARSPLLKEIFTKSQTSIGGILLPPPGHFLTTICLSITRRSSATWEMIPIRRFVSDRLFNAFIAC